MGEYAVRLWWYGVFHLACFRRGIGVRFALRVFAVPFLLLRAHRYDFEAQERIFSDGSGVG